MSAKKHIFYIEDDPLLLDILVRFMNKAGFEVSIAHDGEEALEKIKTIEPDMVLLDLLLPKLHGFEVLRLFKEDKKTAAIPVVILSNLGGKEDIEKGMALGAKSYLVKASLTPEEIIEKIKGVLHAS